MTEYYATDGDGNMLMSACCNDCMRLVPVEISSPNCPFPITMPDNPIYGLECCTCGKIAKPKEAHNG